MKAWIAGLAAAVLAVWFGMPFRTRDTARLLPLRTVQVEADAEGVYLRSEQGEGRGGNWREAVENLRENTPGDVFFDTAEQLVLCGAAEKLLPEIVDSGCLRPAAQIYHAAELRPAKGLNALLNAHESGVTVGDAAAALARDETVSLPEAPDGK